MIKKKILVIHLQFYVQLVGEHLVVCGKKYQSILMWNFRIKAL